MKRWLKLVLAAGMIALSGCAEKKPQAEIGKWHLVEMTADGTSYDENALTEQGIVAELVLRKSGKGTYTVNGEAQTVQWANGEIRLADESIGYELQGGQQLVLHYDDTWMTFARGSAPAVSTAAASTEPAPPQLPDIAGEWRLVEYIQDDVILKEDELAESGDAASLNLAADGTGVLYTGGEEIEVLYDDMVMRVDEALFSYQTVNDELVLTGDSGLVMTFRPAGEDSVPAERTYVLIREITPEGTYTEEDLETVTMTLYGDHTGVMTFPEAEYELTWSDDELVMADETWMYLPSENYVVLHTDEYTMVFRQEVSE